MSDQPRATLDWIDTANRDRADQHLSRTLQARGPSTGRTIVDGGRALLNFASNDYLALACDPRVIEAATHAARTFGWGAGASPAVVGWKLPHQELAQELASFEQAEACLLFPTGFAANQGAIQALTSPGDALYLDRLAHASLVSGARASGAALRVYPHLDHARLCEILQRERCRYRRVLIATEGLFSMDGDQPPLPQLSHIAQHFDCMLLVDEAHATGVVGPEGRGAAAKHQVADSVHVRVGTLSKALGSLGGFVVGTRALITHVQHAAPTFLYSTSLPPAAAAAAREALRISRSEPWRREQLLALSGHLAERLTRLGWNLPEPPSPILPVHLGSPERTKAWSDALLQAGFLVPAIRPPTVPRGGARLRISLNAAHTSADVEALANAIAQLRTRENPSHD